MINTIGGMKQVLDTYSAKDWLKSAEIEKKNTISPQNLSETLHESPVKQKTFGDFLFDAVAKVNDLQKDANLAIEKLATGQSTNLHETMIMVEQAEVAFKTMNQIRMKVLDAYKEIMKMQV